MELLAELVRDPEIKKNPLRLLTVDPTSELNARSFLDTDRVASMLGHSRMRSGHMMTEEWDAFMSGQKDIIKGDHLLGLIQCIGAELLDLSVQDASCAEYQADPHIGRLQSTIYEWKVERESGRLASLVGFSEEMAAARVLHLPQFRWVNDWSHDDMIHFRDIGGSELLREAFHKHRKAIKFATLDKLDSIGEAVDTELRELVSEENKRLESERNELQRKLVRSSLSFTITLGLGVVSVAAPPLLAITVPLAAWSTIVGGASAWDLVSQVILGRKKSDLIGQRPVAFISDKLDSV